mgnify:CR=1 FL=1
MNIPLGSCFTLRNKISPQILATNKNKTSSISVEQTTISISRFFLYWICEKIRSVAACPFFGHDGSTEYNGHIFQLCHTLVEVPLFDGVQKAANTSACHVFTGTSSRNNKSSKLGEKLIICHKLDALLQVSNELVSKAFFFALQRQLRENVFGFLHHLERRRKIPSILRTRCT